MGGQEGQDFVLVGDNDVNDYNDAGILPQSPIVIAEILKWLKPTDYLADSSEYMKHLNSYLAGTGHWIQETEAYRRWHESSDYGSLWTKAIAGAGKSVFAAMIAAKLAKTENVPVLFFFFRQIVATNHDPHALGRDFIAQILRHSPPLQTRMKKYLDDGRTLDTISADEFWEDLVLALASIPKVYCIVDALDEMDIDEEDFLKKLVHLGKQKPANIKVLMTSRPLPRIEAALKDPSVLQVRLEQRLVDRDIATYLDYRLSCRKDLNDDLRRAIKQSVGDKGQGSFLYARLMMDEMLDHMEQMIPDIEFLQQSLNWLPVTIEDMYNGMLLDHSLRSRVPQELQLTILRWVTHSSRPLRLLELADMLNSLCESEQKSKDTKALVRRACGPLLEILEDETVSVIHHSFTEFLVDESRDGRPAPGSLHPQFPIISPPSTHLHLASTCLKYLSSGCLSEWEVQERDEEHFHHASAMPKQAIKLRYPFLDYAMKNWYLHASKPSINNIYLYNVLDDFLRSENHNFLAWLTLNWTHTRSISKITPLHVAAWAGVTNYGKHLIASGCEINCLDGQQRTPLSWASAKGHTQIVALLLDKTSDADVDDYTGLKPLHYAARANHHAVVRLLLAAGVSPLTPKTREHPGRRCGNAPATRGQTPLLYACQSGCTESVREMIPYLKTENMNSALFSAASAGKAEVVDLLLTSDNPPTELDTPLFLAASGMYFHVMRSLLVTGADPNMRCKDVNIGNRESRRLFSVDLEQRNANLGPTLFHAISGVCGSHISTHSDDENVRDCFNLLVDAGSNLKAVDAHGRTALHYAVGRDSHSRPNDALCDLLLRNGADPMAKDCLGNTPLHLFQLNADSAPTMEKFMAHGADINARRQSDGRTPLHTAVDSIHQLDLKVLISRASDWNIIDAKGDTPLHIVLSKSFHPEPVVEHLLKAGSDPSRKNKKGEAPLHLLREFSSKGEAVISLLLSAGANLEAKDNDGRTVLLRILNCQSHNVQMATKMLLGLGADINAVDYQGDGVLHTICKDNRDPSLLQSLIEAGADPFRVNYKGDTLLHTLAIQYTSCDGQKIGSCIDLLLKLGIEVEAENYFGQTAFHLACGTLPGRMLVQNPMDILIRPEFGPSINAKDHSGIRPIHLAATLSEELVARLIQIGADPLSVTHEGRNLLHVAARARQSNIIGLLLEHYSKIDRMDLLDSSDERGRTALHDACRSGRPESVALLLRFGSDPNLRDKEELTPLHVCAEFEKEKPLWYSPEKSVWPGRTIDAASVLLADSSRPFSRDNHNQHQKTSGGMWSNVTIENDCARVRETIRLLVAYGADIAALSQSKGFPIDVAVSFGCEEMVTELLPRMEEIYSRAMGEQKPHGWRGSCPRNQLGETYLNLRSKHICEGLEVTVLRGENNLYLCNQLLALGEYGAIEQLPHLGVSFEPKSGYLQDFLTILAQWGYTSLFEVLGLTVQKEHWIDGKESPDRQYHNAIWPYLMTAATSRLPNLDTIKVIIEQFGANVNIQPELQVYQSRSSHKYLPGPSALHKLACGTHWWQLEAIEYLIEHGADVELKNEKGQTVLHVAVSNDHSFGTYRRRETAKLLLERGANPNVLDGNGLTCLNKGVHDVELVRLLMKHGADMSLGDKPILFSAIGAQDTATVAVLLQSGADCNTRRKVEEKPKDRRHIHENSLYEYPIHYAASSKLNTAKGRVKAIPIIKLLLENGADPYREFHDTTIIHDLFQHGGILQPFLHLSNLDIERRDSKGRTIFLASCLSSYGTRSQTDYQDGLLKPFLERKKEITAGDPTPAATLYERGADLTTVDNDGNNALHLLLLASPHNDEEFKKTFSMFIDEAPSLVHHKNFEGWKPFHYAIRGRRAWSCDLLLRAGANALEKDPDGNTPLHHLLGSQNQRPQWGENCQKYIDLGVSINEKNNLGETAAFKYLKVAGCWWENDTSNTNYFLPLIDAGADAFARNNEGQTLLHVVANKANATRGNKPDVVKTFKYLMDLGLDPLVEDLNQRTALDVAAACGNGGILGLFKRDTESKV